MCIRNTKERVDLEKSYLQAKLPGHIPGHWGHGCDMQLKGQENNKITGNKNKIFY